jgi:precorrin-6Y C5,15-methyltransferase (decarboxylating)
VAPDAFAALPAPHAVFVGGGGVGVGAIVESAFQRLRPGGSLVAAAILLETRARLLDCLPERRIEMVEIEVRRARPLGPGHKLEPGNPVALFVYRKERS